MNAKLSLTPAPLSMRRRFRFGLLGLMVFATACSLLAPSEDEIARRRESSVDGADEPDTDGSGDDSSAGGDAASDGAESGGDAADAGPDSGCGGNVKFCDDFEDLPFGAKWTDKLVAGGTVEVDTVDFFAPGIRGFRATSQVQPDAGAGPSCSFFGGKRSNALYLDYGGSPEFANRLIADFDVRISALPTARTNLFAQATTAPGLISLPCTHSIFLEPSGKMGVNWFGTAYPSTGTAMSINSWNHIRLRISPITVPLDAGPDADGGTGVRKRVELFVGATNVLDLEFSCGGFPLKAQTQLGLACTSPTDAFTAAFDNFTLGE